MIGLTEVIGPKKTPWKHHRARRHTKETEKEGTTGNIAKEREVIVDPHRGFTQKINEVDRGKEPVEESENPEIR